MLNLHLDITHEEFTALLYYAKVKASGRCEINGVSLSSVFTQIRDQLLEDKRKAELELEMEQDSYYCSDDMIADMYNHSVKYGEAN